MIYYRIFATVLALVATTAAASSIAPGEPCPSSGTEALEGDACLPFIGGACPFGQFCCGDDCYEETFCHCDDDSLTLQCGPKRVACPSKCPASKPEEGELCDISELDECRYGSGTCLNYFNETRDNDIICSCQSGTYTCDRRCPSFGSGPTRPGNTASGSEAENGTTNEIKVTKGKKSNTKKQKKTKKKNTRRLGASY